MGRCVVLMYHVVDKPRSNGEARFCCTPEMFALQMKHLADDGWNVIRLSELVSHLRAGTDPGKRSVAITLTRRSTNVDRIERVPSTMV